MTPQQRANLLLIADQARRAGEKAAKTTKPASNPQPATSYFA